MNKFVAKKSPRICTQKSNKNHIDPNDMHTPKITCENTLSKTHVFISDHPFIHLM